ncbi:unnamed protein product [Durusdinium trenchii]|uniref:Ubiquitin-like domain-containing protein n=1 Tax=Durusdinium trenchii TaxID=1381693 RepID=A0ABP0PLW8_9DINO
MAGCESEASEAQPSRDEREAESLHLRLQIDNGSGVQRADVHLPRTAQVVELKEREHLGVDVSSGWRVRFVFRGRLLSESEPLSQLPSGACVQCYLQPLPVEHVEADPDPLLLSWARLAGVGRALPPEKWQDVVFHSAIIVGLAAAWSLYLASPNAFDLFSRSFLRFLSAAWVLAFIGDFVITPGLPAPLRRRPWQTRTPRRAP